MRRLMIVVFVLAAACSRRPRHTTLTSVELEAGQPSQASLAELVSWWNRAMSQRDVSLLGPLYASTVDFYGAPLRHDQIIQVQGDAFTKDPSFTQQILGIDEINATRIELRREWIHFGKTFRGKSWLEGRNDGKRWVIVGIGHISTDEAAPQAGGPEPSFCRGLAKTIALSTSEARALVEGPPGNVHASVPVGPPVFPGYAVAMTTPLDAGAVTVGWYDVEPCFIYSPGPNIRGAPGACVPPGGAYGVVTDVLSGRVLSPDLKLLPQMSKCRH